MKKMNFTNSLPLAGAKAIRPFGFVVALALVFLFGTQSASAQTPQDVGEAATEQAVNVINREINELELETKTPPPGVNTESNEALVKYYRTVIDQFLDGGDFRQIMLENTGVMNEGTTDPAMADMAIMDSFGPGSGLLLPLNSDDYKSFLQLVDVINLEDNSDQDLINIFNFLRTLKNQ